MIDPKELRIGNASQRPAGQLVFVSEILKDGFHYNDEGESAGGWHSFHDGEYLKSIPLTEEWLVRMGFTVVRDGRLHYHIADCNIFLDDNFAPCVYVNEDIEQFNVGEPLEFVHRVQNFYFALTGKELEIK